MGRDRQKSKNNLNTLLLKTYLGFEFDFLVCRAMFIGFIIRSLDKYDAC
jgi:hypothetical protein